MEDLKAIFSAGVVATSAAAEWTSRRGTQSAYSDDEIDNEDGVGYYYSLPLDGRVSLIPLDPLPWVDENAEEKKREEEERQILEHQAQAEREQQQQQQAQRGGSSPNRPWSPPQTNWDPSQGPPPSGGEHQMRNPPDAYYQNAWDLPQPRASDQSSAQRKAAFFTPSSGVIPPQLQREHFFHNLGSERPDPSRVKAVFPWETRGSNPFPSRVFPDEPESMMPRGRALAASHEAASHPSNSASSIERDPISGHQSPDPQQHGLPPNLSYTNAWDEVGAIGKYADRVRRVTNPSPSRGEVGVQANPEVSARGSQTAQARHRTRGSQADGSLGVDVDGENGGSGSGGNGSDSRDGDDESSSGEEDSEIDDSLFTSPTSKGSSNNKTSSAKGYQRKAEAFAQASPRSPRHAPSNSLNMSASSTSQTSPTGTASITGRARIRPEGFSRVGSGSGSGGDSSNATPVASPVFQMTDFGGRRSSVPKK